jgi:hypothetical protein
MGTRDKRPSTQWCAAWVILSSLAWSYHEASQNLSETVIQATMWQDAIQSLHRQGAKFDDRYNEICEDFADKIQEIVEGQVPIRSRFDHMRKL